MLDVFDTAAHRPPRLGERLAVLARHRRREVLELLLHQELQLEEVAGADDWWDFTPFEICRLCGRHGGIDIPHTRERHFPELLAGGGIGEIEILGGGGSDPLPTDVVAKGFHPLSLGPPRGLSTKEPG